MCDFTSITEMINSYGSFYHVTPIKNLEGITKFGLLTNSDLEYDDEATYKKAQICFCPKHKLEELKSTIGQDLEENNVAVFRINSQILSSKDIGLDWTFEQTKCYQHLDEINWLKKSIDVLGTVACFESIPIEELERVE